MPTNKGRHHEVLSYTVLKLTTVIYPYVTNTSECVKYTQLGHSLLLKREKERERERGNSQSTKHPKKSF